MNQMLSILHSMKTMAILMSLFAFAIGYATFIENDYGTITAKADVFNAWWFELLFAFLTCNLALNIYKHKMFTLNKAPIFLFHMAFIVIVFGAAVTRYFGYEGTMHIRENSSASTMTSAETFFTVSAKVGEKSVGNIQAVYLSKRSSNSLEASLELEGKKVDVELLEYIPDAIESIVEDTVHGTAIASMMVTGGGQGKQITLKQGTFFEMQDAILNFGATETFTKPVIDIFIQEGKLHMKHALSIQYLKMDDRSEGTLEESESELLASRTLFTVGQSSFVLREFLPQASMKIVSNPKASAMRPEIDALRFKITVDGVSKTRMIFGQPGVLGRESHNDINGVDVHISYGAKTIRLPFSIKLKDFQLDRYPGSMSPASYASEVVLVDKEEGIEMPYRIYMNNILEHRGYRFFQSSYDQDEKGTILSVNNDPGTLPSYIGYFLMGVGMFWSLFSRKNRFAKLAAKASKARASQTLLVAITLLVSSMYTPVYAEKVHPNLEAISAFDAEHADSFGTLIVQDSGGRMKPMNTLATEVLAKIHKSPSMKIGEKSISANQAILGMMVKPDTYKSIRMIQTKDAKINTLIGLDKGAKYASFGQFFEDPNAIRGYKLAELVDNAVRKEAKYRDKFDKKVLEIDERVNVSFMVFTGQLVKIWPKIEDANNKWFPTLEALQTFEGKESELVRMLAVNYFTAVDASIASGDWTGANKALEAIGLYQKKFGTSVYPSEMRVKAEVFYNEMQVFERIYPLYLLVGFILLIMSFIKILKPSFDIDSYAKKSLYVLVGLFIAHTLGLANRWYISGHAPWSNGYESMIYIAWATVFAGFIFSKRSSMTMASTGVLAGLILFVAHLNWMNPQVTNLVPVLNSYWLSIHVSMITASYGFLGLGALLGFISIILFTLKTEANSKHISSAIKELGAINEMSLMVGVILLTVGNFLGGVWANESWGRYWGWDPKETWALVTILVYAVILHLRFIKSIYSEYNFAVITTLAYTSVLMTYFGVNYYLSGLHSYAAGDPVPIPDFVPVTYTVLFLMITLAFRNRKLA